MTRNTKMKTPQDPAADTGNDVQGQQPAPPRGQGQGVTVAPADVAADAATDQEIDTASVGLEQTAERPRAKKPPAATPQADGAPGDGPPPGGKDGDPTRGVLVAGD